MDKIRTLIHIKYAKLVKAPPAGDFVSSFELFIVVFYKAITIFEIQNKLGMLIEIYVELLKEPDVDDNATGIYERDG